MYSLFSFQSAGLSATGDPRIILGDTISSYNNLVNSKLTDLVFSGSNNPLLFGSVMNTFKFRNLSISLNIIYRFKYYFRRNSIDYNSLLNTGWFAHKDYTLRWTKPGDEKVTIVPSLPSVVNPIRDMAYLNSDVLIEKGDHIRLQDIRLDYLVSGSSKQAIKGINLYLVASNLGILWRANKSGLDPNAYQFRSIPLLWIMCLVTCLQDIPD